MFALPFRGVFEMRVPRGADSVAVAVLASGFPVTLQTIPVGGDQMRQLVVPIDRGELFIPMNRTSSPPMVASLNGLPLPLGALVFPFDGSGLPQGVQKEGFVIAMAPGAYTVCTDACRTVVIRAAERTTVRPTERKTAQRTKRD